MPNKDDNNIFLQSLDEVKPIKKNNKITRPIPKPIKSNTPRTIIKEAESDRIYEKAKNAATQQKITIQKNEINKKLKKNKIPINRKIDFHGCSLDEAKKIFFNTINDCFSKNYRNKLIGYDLLLSVDCSINDAKQVRIDHEFFYNCCFFRT